MIKYIGSKRVLVDTIVAISRKVPDAHHVCDLFTGTTRVAQGLKKAGHSVLANDTASYSEVLALTYIVADRRTLDLDRLEGKLAYLSRLPDQDGYFTKTFSQESQFFQPHNARRIDAIRPAIDEIAEDRIEWAILLTSLMEAADRVDSTTGVQMAYVKKWSARSFNDLELRLPRLLRGSGKATRRDAVELARDLDNVDLCYIDPPYNQHSYFSNYHIWETLVRNDAPEAYGIARKRIDCRTTKSNFNSKKAAWGAFSRMIRALRVRHALVSFNNEGFFTAAEIMNLLASRFGEVAYLPVEHKRYVGAQIGIHNPQGEKVGTVSHLKNKEYLFLAGPEAVRILGEVAISREQAQLTLDCL